MAKLTHLTSLNLRQNYYVSYNGAAELFAKLTKLEKLDLSDNDISYNDAKELDKLGAPNVFMLNRDCDNNITLQSRIAAKGRKEGHFIDNTFKGFYIH
ncbi:hypothetical protein [Wolbachia endosymbiont of Tettigetta isshikii]|uniref:hypothetical protein n=1 Tax=Wolbachia endosymbiont of Tettigetta isshikii TaxID=3239093 RepID=UPI00397EC45A